METEIDKFLVLFLAQMIDKSLKSAKLTHPKRQCHLCREFDSLSVCSKSIFYKTIIEHFSHYVVKLNLCDNDTARTS